MNISYIPHGPYSYNQEALDHSNKFLHFLASPFLAALYLNADKCLKVNQVLLPSPLLDMLISESSLIPLWDSK